VHDVADDLARRQHPRDPSELVDEKGHLDVAPVHVEQEIGQRAGFRVEDAFAQHPLERAVRAPQQLGRVDVAHEVVGPGARHGQEARPGLDGEARHVGQALAVIDDRDLVERRHHLSRALLPEIEDVLDDALVVPREADLLSARCTRKRRSRRDRTSSRSVFC